MLDGSSPQTASTHCLRATLVGITPGSHGLPLPCYPTWLLLIRARGCVVASLVVEPSHGVATPTAYRSSIPFCYLARRSCYVKWVVASPARQPRRHLPALGGCRGCHHYGVTGGRVGGEDCGGDGEVGEGAPPGELARGSSRQSADGVLAALGGVVRRQTSKAPWPPIQVCLDKAQMDR